MQSVGKKWPNRIYLYFFRCSQKCEGIVFTSTTICYICIRVFVQMSSIIIACISHKKRITFLNCFNFKIVRSLFDTVSSESKCHFDSMANTCTFILYSLLNLSGIRSLCTIYAWIVYLSVNWRWININVILIERYEKWNSNHTNICIAFPCFISSFHEFDGKIVHV